MSREKNRWDQAIEDVNDSIAKCQRKIESLEMTRKLLEESRAAGEPWPGK